MDDKTFELMEKMYIEFSLFKTDIKDIKNDLTAVKQDLTALNVKVERNTLLIEDLTSKVETIAEVQKSHMAQNEKDHNDIVENVNKKIDVIELSTKNTSKDVKEIKNGLLNVEIMTTSNSNLNDIA
ncbi:hypothetical protein [Clostridium lacusfryxellense]|uniref:hypothetical protein n=1 Tax=Clostridium lacusfryxellense TaxID=205328 RepID=UPI001C0D282B|nr:hypothetical protein [Clostridium lacusfryxellense]MBU3111470.1 hypothetical protein [Clostridium lacusfryxellense]